MPYRLKLLPQKGPRVGWVLVWRSPTMSVLLVPSEMVVSFSGVVPESPSEGKTPRPFGLAAMASGTSSQHPPNVFVVEVLPIPVMALYELAMYRVGGLVCPPPRGAIVSGPKIWPARVSVGQLKILTF